MNAHRDHHEQESAWRAGDGAERDEVGGDMLKGAIAGAVGVWVMDRVDWYMFDHEDPEARRRTEAVRRADSIPRTGPQARSRAPSGPSFRRRSRIPPASRCTMRSASRRARFTAHCATGFRVSERGGACCGASGSSRSRTRS